MTLVYCQVQRASLGRTEGTLYMFLQIPSRTKVGQFGFGNGYSNETLFLFSHLEFPAEWLAEWRKWRCQGTGQGWVCDLRLAANLCLHALLPLAYRGMILSVCTETMICLGSYSHLTKNGPWNELSRQTGDGPNTGNRWEHWTARVPVWPCEGPFPLWASLCLVVNKED